MLAQTSAPVINNRFAQLPRRVCIGKTLSWEKEGSSANQVATLPMHELTCLFPNRPLRFSFHRGNGYEFEQKTGFCRNME